MSSLLSVPNSRLVVDIKGPNELGAVAIVEKVADSQ